MNARIRIVAEAHMPVVDDVASLFARRGHNWSLCTARMIGGVSVLTFASTADSQADVSVLLDELTAAEAVRCAEFVLLP